MRRPFQFVADVVVLCSAFFVAYLLRLDFNLSDYHLDNALNQLPLVVLVQFSVLFLIGAYSILWRYVSLEDIKVFLKAALVSGLILLAFRLLLSPDIFIRWQVPLSVILMDTVLAFGGLLGLRVLRRFFYELSEKKRFTLARKKITRHSTLFVGAGRIGASVVKEIVGRRDGEFDIKGFIDDDRFKKGGSVGGLKVLGTTDDMARLVDELKIDQIVIAIDQAQGKEIRRILDICQAIPVKARIVPSFHEIVHGHVKVSRIRDVQIEDLLGREPVALDNQNLNEFLTDKVVMVTGAGGSIGAELVRQVAAFRPRKILLVERAEFFLFQIEQEVRRAFSDLTFVPLIADIGDEQRMKEIFENYRPAVVFHAAAHKHVPLMESNSCEAIKNNVFATELVGTLAGTYGANAFVLVSTDKAVNPTSVMGASKRVAEIVIQNLGHRFDTRYIAVRFGNVLGSAGSVVPIFAEQIQKGGPVTVTDQKMTRYFMTIPEASQLVMQAGALGSGGEIFILDMGVPVRILDLAEDMIRLSGLLPYEDVDIVFTGVRPGEKLFEELELTGENLVKTRHPKIFIGKIAAYEPEKVTHIVRSFRDVIKDNNEAELRQLFNEFIPEATIEVKKQEVLHVAKDSPSSNGTQQEASTQSA
ncbi:MAG TPA: nucleoside-diphosphate sugar epimerase/dehydratase [Pyrinomonadaceae bacterium]|nr:nucleoside-diphosphate sugar epimerase/dehydratase [Pyrinomonadaceae bacterium]